MIRTSQNVSPELKAEIKQALRDWVGSLSRSDARAPATNVSGKEYTPLEILKAVEDETEFGVEFLSSLCSLHEHMAKRRPGLSVVALIRRSLAPSAT